jgi:hexokinase
VIPTQVGELTFKKFQNVNEHLLTGYLDFETTHEQHEILCHVCDELRERSFSKLFKKKIYKTCIKQKHPKPSSFLCDGCLKDYHTMVTSSTCKHKKIEYTRDGEKYEFSTCHDCHTNLQSQIKCDHTKTQTLTNLEPISYNFK